MHERGAMDLSRVIAVALAVGGCRAQAGDAPDEGGRVDPDAWRARDVPECRYAVQMPGMTTRHDLKMAEFPDVVSVAYASESGLSAECTVYPASMALPDAEGLVRGTLQHYLVNAEGLGGGITGQTFEVEPGSSPPAGRTRVTFGNGGVRLSRVIVVGRQVHELTAFIAPHRASEADYARLLASYAVR